MPMPVGTTVARALSWNAATTWSPWPLATAVSSNVGTPEYNPCGEIEDTSAPGSVWAFWAAGVARAWPHHGEMTNPAMTAETIIAHRFIVAPRPHAAEFATHILSSPHSYRFRLRLPRYHHLV